MNSSSAEYLIVGGHSVGFHGFPRVTGGFDFFVRASPGNAARLIEVFEQFGFDDVQQLQSVLESPGRSIKIGRPPDRLDVITEMSGVDFEEAWDGRAAAEFDGVPVVIIGRRALLLNKRASARPKDLLDVAEIERLNHDRNDL